MEKFFDSGLYLGRRNEIPLSDTVFVEVEIVNVIKIDGDYYVALSNPLHSQSINVFLIQKLIFDNEFPKSQFLKKNEAKKIRPQIEKATMFHPSREIEFLNHLQKMLDEARKENALFRMGAILYSIDYICNGGWRRFQSNVFDV